MPCEIDWPGNMLIAWKYAIPGLIIVCSQNASARLIQGHAEQRLLDLLLQRCQEQGWVKTGGRQRTDSTHIEAAIRTLTRTLRVAQTMVYVLNVHAAGGPRVGCCSRAS